MDQTIGIREIRGDGVAEGQPDYVISAVQCGEIKPGTYLRIVDEHGTITHIVHRFHDAFAKYELAEHHHQEEDKARKFLQSLVRRTRWELGLPIYY